MRFATIVSTVTVLVGAAAPAAATLRCNLGNWYWKDKDCCIQVGGPQSPPSPPSGNQCPNMWFWNKDTNCCAPRYIPPYSQPSCGNGWVWNPSTYSCRPPATPPPTNDDCGPNKWWWKNRSCCLPHGNPSPPLPPRGNNCPPNWYWHGQQGCCVPQHPPPAPVPSCPPNWEWNPYTQCCKPTTPTPPGPQPSRRATTDNTKRHGAIPQHKKKATPSPSEAVFCPVGKTACPIGGIFSTEFECFDTLSDLKSCGGCASVGAGQDCSAIPNVSVSSCDSGSCTVLSCNEGYAISEDKLTCVPHGHEL
ncbi:unnamed protein product [Rhizoctonia solani]|uniref:Protein CPL1-like domain-containing protein n=1 Tax=Rhizoctonia solani TaxID=456999 RepID=A0A8H3D072_9AGAM|nr:unnamed protein product [Rhizoctonia solani]